ncbi:MAG: hypothetical protein HOP08_14535 [Cyclobacteriaceae bacterium]|nr:hypothetical protein [Cyclobacteriaceae bacterium]
MTWGEELRTSRAKWAITFCAVTFLLMFLLMPVFYRDVITPKKGILLDDVFLNLFVPHNWSLPIFLILYLAVANTILRAVKDPETVILGVTVYCAVNLLRTLTMYLVTLEPPTGMILLVDPISSALYPDSGFAKDLFFSGHVSTIMIVVILEKKRVFKILNALGTVVIAILLAWQHVHYTLDLVAAPLATYGVFLLIRKYYRNGPEVAGTAGNTKSN